jgi:cytochrome c553
MKKLLLLTVAVLSVAALTARAADGKELYEKQCAKCHGKDGKGDTKMGKKYGCKDYTDPKVQEKLKDEDATKAVKKGYKDKDGKEVMKPAEDMSDDDVKAVVAHLRSFKGK